MSQAYQNDDLATLPNGFKPATTQINGEEYQHIILYDGSGNIISTINPLPVSDSDLLTELKLKADLDEKQPVILYDSLENPISSINPFPISDTGLWKMLDALTEISTTLKKIENHLFLASDNELKDQDV